MKDKLIKEKPKFRIENILSNMTIMSCINFLSVDIAEELSKSNGSYLWFPSNQTLIYLKSQKYEICR